VNAELDTEQVRLRLIAACDLMLEKTDVLTKADQAIGDGDHGVTMARGFKAARETLDKQTFGSPGEAFASVGMTLMSTCGGASGAVFGTLFRAAGRSMSTEPLDAATLVRGLSDGLNAVKKRGGAKAGDKTMIDGLEPAIEAARAASTAGVESALLAAAQGAAEGVEATKNMVAKTGKSKTLGERARGYPDPGALSLSFILEALSQHAVN
jgi:dihydroxyacetone kinase-like protein